MNVIYADFSPDFRATVFTYIKYFGVKRAEARLLAGGVHPSVAKVIIRSIMGREGW